MFNLSLLQVKPKLLPTATGLCSTLALLPTLVAFCFPHCCLCTCYLGLPWCLRALQALSAQALQCPSHSPHHAHQQVSARLSWTTSPYPPKYLAVETCCFFLLQITYRNYFKLYQNMHNIKSVILITFK